MNYDKNRMDTKVATQTCSNSTAESLDCLREELKHEDFLECAPTSEFFRMINELFDIFNSKSKCGLNHCVPVSPKTIEKIKSSFSRIEMYIKGLKTLDGKLVLCGPRKKALLGIYQICIHSLTCMMIMLEVIFLATY